MDALSMSAKGAIKLLTEDINQKIQETSRQIISFGIIVFLSYPVIYYLVLHSDLNLSYQNLNLTLAASLFCLPLIFHRHWPRSLRKWLPLYWYFTVAYCLPFFFTFMTLKNDAATIWLMNCMSALFFLFLLFDVMSAIIILGISVPIAFLCYLDTTQTSFNYTPGTIGLVSILSSFSAAFIIGAIFSHNKQKVENARLKTLTAFGDMIAHEMRTPLISINMTGITLKRWLPALLETYQIAEDSNLNIPHVDKRIRDKLPINAHSIEIDSAQAQQIINILLTNIEGKKTEFSQLQTRHIVNLVNEALERYAFDLSDRSLIEFDSTVDFELRANDFFINVIFNLIKNALHQIRAVNKGKITIWAIQGSRYNELHFKDTAKGLSKRKLAQLFKPFVSDTQHGTGLGLAFCKMVMESYGGSIRCESKEGEYAEFILSFPKVISY